MHVSIAEGEVYAKNGIPRWPDEEKKEQGGRGGDEKNTGETLSVSTLIPFTPVQCLSNVGLPLKRGSGLACHSISNVNRKGVVKFHA